MQEYQDQGCERTLSDANEEIACSRNLTPPQARHLFTSYVRFDRAAGYIWGWVLK